LGPLLLSLLFHAANSQNFCPTEATGKTVVINTTTGKWEYFQDRLGNVVNVATGTEGETVFDNNKNRIKNDLFEEHSNKEPGNRNRRLPALSRSYKDSIENDLDLFSSRILSTDGSNSIVINQNGDEKMRYVKICKSCNDSADITYEALCPLESSYCQIDSTDPNNPTAICTTRGFVDAVAMNVWPLLWLWYAVILAGCVCTFQGRIILDFVRGTILYYCCGFGDRFRNREMRNVDRYNHRIVQEIMEEEIVDRQEVRRRRNNGSFAGRRMNDVANRDSEIHGSVNDDEQQQSQGIPPTITMSPSFGYSNNGDNDGNDVEGNNSDSDSQTQRSNWLVEYFRGVVWPWQTSWNHYIKYNLLLRVQWIALQDELAFIESRQERGLPHAQFEMKTRLWNASKEGCISCASSSIAGNSVNVPHCSICFCELEDGDRVGDLSCTHVFHAECLKMWVAKKNACPLCNVPIAHRRRISSEELIQEDVSCLHINNNNTPEEAYDHTLPPLRAGSNVYGSPSNAQRQGQRRLSQFPMTPSTVAASSYSDENDFIDLEAVDLVHPLAQNSDDDHEMNTSSPVLTNNSSSVELTPVRRISRINEVQEAVDEESEHDDISDSRAPVAASLDDTGIDYHTRESSSTADTTAQFPSNDARSDDGLEVDIPSPPRRVRRRTSDAYSTAFAALEEEEDGHTSEESWPDSPVVQGRPSLQSGVQEEESQN